MENNKQLLLPRTDDDGNSYISNNQVVTWRRSKREYIRNYFMGEGFKGNAYTDFGSKVGEALEHNDFNGFTKSEQDFLKTIPRYNEFERKIKMQLDGFYVLGFIDTNLIDGVDPHVFVPILADYKTGDIESKRGYYESDEFFQTDIYAAALYQEYGVIPSHTEVFLIGRSGNAFKREKLKLTKEFITISRKVTVKRLEEVNILFQETAEEISAYYKVFLKLKG